MLTKLFVYLLVHITALVAADFSQPTLQKPNLRIINGNNAPIDAHPFMVYIVSGGTYCGGALISRQHVLTAAHCIKGDDTFVLVGAHNVQDRNEPNRIRIYASAAVTHPNFTGSASHDIAVIKLSSPAPQNKYIQVAQLPARPNPADYYANKDAMAYGWGRTQTTPIVRASVLQMLETKVLAPSARTCSIYQIPTDSLCVTRRNGAKGNVCNGDSGSPLMADGTMIGLVHGHIGFPCEISEVASFARIDSHLDWIRQTMARM